MRFLLLVAAIVALPRLAHANPQDIEEGEPVTLEDAFTDPPGQLSLQYSGSYGLTKQRAASRTALLEQGPTFKLGAVSGVQVSLNPNYDTGTASGRNAGFLLGDVLVQLNRQTRLLPAMAVDVFYSAPFGAGRKSTATTVRAIASKYLGSSETAPRLHLNLTAYRLTQPDGGDRRNQLQLAFGGSAPVTGKDAIVADIVYGNAEQVRRSETFVELGYSRDLPEDWTFQIGVGRQVAGGANAVRVFFAFEKELQIY
jgi:hypothetical protein